MYGPGGGNAGGQGGQTEKGGSERMWTLGGTVSRQTDVRWIDARGASGL